MFDQAVSARHNPALATGGLEHSKVTLRLSGRGRGPREGAREAHCHECVCKPSRSLHRPEPGPQEARDFAATSQTSWFSPGDIGPSSLWGEGGRKETGKVNVGGNKTNQRIRFSFSSLVFPAGKGAMMGPVASVRASKPRFGLVLAVVIVVVSSCGRGDHALLGGVAGNPQYLPRADILQPEPDEAMLTESGGLLLLFQVFDWESGRMRVKVRMMRSPCTPQHALSAQIP